MATEIGWAGLGIAPDLTGFDSKLSRGLHGPLSRAGNESGRRFGVSFGKVAVGAAAGVIGAGFAAFRIASSAFEAGSESLKIARLTRAEIKATGGVAKITAREIGNLSERLSNKTAIDDEQIQTAANMLLTFKNVRDETDKGASVFDRATASALDLSILFGSTESGAKMLGKALNDPEKGITALSRAGVTFSESQKKQIEKLVEQNDLLGAQKIILREVESQVGGSAESQATAWDKVQVSLGNVSEKLGIGLMPHVQDFSRFMRREGVPVLEGFVDKLADDAIPAFVDWIKDDAAPAVENFIDDARPLAKNLLPAMGDALGVARDALSTAAPLAADLIGAFRDAPDWVQKVLVGGVVGGAAAKKLGVLDLVLKPGGKDGLLGGITKASPLPVWVVNSGGLPGDGPDKTPKGSWLPKAAVTASLAVAVPVAAGWLIREMNERTAPATPYKTVNKIPDWYSNQPDGSVLGRQNRENAADAWRVPDLLPDTYKDTQALLDTSTRLRNLWNELPPEVRTHVTAPGLIDTHREVRDLIKKYDLKLDKRKVKTLYQLLGVDKAISDYDRIIAKQRELAALVGHQVSLDTPGPGRSTQGGVTQGTGLSINYNGPVTYTDDREGRRRAQQERRRSQTDGVRR